LFRKKFDCLLEGSLIVGDRLYCAYFILADLMRRGHDVAIRLTTLRELKLERAKVRKLKNGDWIIS
jgi:hypothetical protein